MKKTMKLHDEMVIVSVKLTLWRNRPLIFTQSLVQFFLFMHFTFAGMCMQMKCCVFFLNMFLYVVQTIQAYLVGFVKQT